MLRALVRLRPAPPDRTGSRGARGGQRSAWRSTWSRESICGTFGGSALTADIDVPKGALADEMGTASRSPTSRRATRSSCRSRWPGPKCWKPSDIFIGVNALDYSGYPDCRPEYIEAYERMANLATKAGVEGRTRSRSTRR